MYENIINALNEQAESLESLNEGLLDKIKKNNSRKGIIGKIAEGIGGDEYPYKKLDTTIKAVLNAVANCEKVYVRKGYTLDSLLKKETEQLSVFDEITKVVNDSCFKAASIIQNRPSNWDKFVKNMESLSNVTESKLEILYDKINPAKLSKGDQWEEVDKNDAMRVIEKIIRDHNSWYEKYEATPVFDGKIKIVNIDGKKFYGTNDILLKYKAAKNSNNEADKELLNYYNEYSSFVDFTYSHNCVTYDIGPIALMQLKIE